MASDYPPHVQKLLEALRACGKVDTKLPRQFRSPCPAHGGDGMSLVTYFEKQVTFKCYSNDCQREEILLALGLTEADLRPESSNGCTLRQYADYKQLPMDSLTEFGLKDVQRGSLPAVEMPYFGEDQSKLATRFRVSLDGSPKVKSKQGSTSHLYGLWRLPMLKFANALVIVEGESDCHTLWHQGVQALGIPGAQQVNLVMAELLKIADRFADADFYLLVEPDEGGLSFMRSFAKSPLKDRIRAIRLDGFKDPSEMHCDDPKRFKKRWQKAIASAKSYDDVLEEQGIRELADLAPAVAHLMATGTGRQQKREMSGLVADFLIRKGHLMAAESDEVREPEPYMLVDGTPQPLAESCSAVCLALQDLGLNPIEPAFRWLVRDLQKAALSRGRLVRVSRYSTWSDGKLYVSCGRNHVVVAERMGLRVELRKVSNGEEGVLFAGRSVFPEWEPTEGLDPASVAAFRPAVEPPPEAKAYSQSTQTALLEAWLACVLAGCNAPILLAFGGFGSGKSLTLEAAVRLFMGDSKSVSQAPNDERSFYSLVSAEPIYILDNLDSPPPAWMEDGLAQAATGGEFSTRRQYTNADVHRSRLRAKIGVTSRTAEFAKRKDIQDRLLPLFYRPMLPAHRRGKDELLAEVDENRDAILSQLIYNAALGLTGPKGKAILPTRFQEFGRILSEVAGDEAPSMLEALEVAQQLGVRDPDPLTRALLEFPEDLRGTAAQIIEELRDAGFKGLPTRGGKTVAGRIRECAQVLRLNGFSYREESVGRNTIFTIIKPVA